MTALPALLAGAVLAMATAADEEGIALGQLYTIGLAAVAIIIQLLHPIPAHVELAYQLGVCIFVTLTGLLFSVRRTATELLKAVGLPPVVGARGLDFVLYSTAILAAIRSWFVPPKSSASVRTETATAPARSYERACSAASRSAIGPAEGEERFTSAITAGTLLAVRMA